MSDEGEATLRKAACIHVLYGPLDGRGVHQPIVDEQQKDHLLHIVINIGYEASQLELQFVLLHAELKKLLHHCGSVHRPDVVHYGVHGGGLHVHAGLPNLLESKAHPRVVYSILGDYVSNLVVLLGTGPEGGPPGGDVVEEVLHGNGGALVSCQRCWGSHHHPCTHTCPHKGSAWSWSGWTVGRRG